MRVFRWVCLIFVCIFVCGCDNNRFSSKYSPKAFGGDKEILPAVGIPRDYFPTAVGQRWSYKITLPESLDALFHSVVSWPLDNNNFVGYETRGRYYLGQPNVTGTYRLSYRIVAASEKQGGLQYPEGYKLEIEQDDVGIFMYAQEVYLAISTSGRYMAHFVILHDPDAPGSPRMGGAWGSYGAKPGQSMRIIFFGEKPGMQIGLSGEHDDLLFVGGIKHNGVDALRFIRTVAPSERVEEVEPSGIDVGFTEETIFEKGIGLVSLIQKVNGKTTMSWELER